MFDPQRTVLPLTSQTMFAFLQPINNSNSSTDARWIKAAPYHSSYRTLVPSTSTNFIPCKRVNEYDLPKKKRYVCCAAILRKCSLCSVRRPNSSGIVGGNNKFGRAGKPRCLQCRVWKQRVLHFWHFWYLQCEYTQPELPCKLCIEKRFPCGRKIRGEKQHVSQEDPLGKNEESIFENKKVDATKIIRQPVCLDEEIPEPTDSICIEYYFRRTSNTGITDNQPKHVGIPEYLKQRFGHDLSSKSVRFAVILTATGFASSDKPTLDSNQITRCRDLFYRHTQHAIHRKLYSDLVYACYFIVNHSISFNQSINESVIHARGFLLSLEKLRESSTLSSEEMFLIRRMWLQILEDIECTDCYVERRGEYGSRAKLMFPVVQRAQSVFSAPTNCLSKTNCIAHHVVTRALIHELDIYFRYYFSQASIGLEEHTSNSHLGQEIEALVKKLSALISRCNVLNKLYDRISRTLVPQILDGESIQEQGVHYSWEIGAVFTCGQFLLESIMLCRPWSESSREEAVDIAMFVCRLRMLVKQSHDFRYFKNDGAGALFMASLILNDVEFPIGPCQFVSC